MELRGSKCKSNHESTKGDLMEARSCARAGYRKSNSNHENTKKDENTKNRQQQQNTPQTMCKLLLRAFVFFRAFVIAFAVYVTM
jgi:hypothetical protein